MIQSNDHDQNCPEDEFSQCKLHADTPVEAQLQALRQVPESDQHRVMMLPIDSIRVVNPRGRNKQKFKRIVDNINDIGLKRPITVRPRGNGSYDLICGEGRLKAFRQLGQTEVPAILRDVSEEDMLLMGLVENIARRRPTTMDTIRRLAELRDRRYNHTEIGKKTGIGPSYVSELLYLFDRGEERLLQAVESGRIPITAAILISRNEHEDVQAALLECLEQNKITPLELRRARTLADVRKAFGKLAGPSGSSGSRGMTSESVVRAFKREQEKQRLAIKRADLCRKRLVFTVNALIVLLGDENFVNLLRAEGLTTLPDCLAEQIEKGDFSE